MNEKRRKKKRGRPTIIATNGEPDPLAVRVVADGVGEGVGECGPELGGGASNGDVVDGDFGMTAADEHLLEFGLAERAPRVSKDNNLRGLRGAHQQHEANKSNHELTQITFFTSRKK